jgi:hypothetical protein
LKRPAPEIDADRFKGPVQFVVWGQILGNIEAIEDLRNFVMDHGLPATEFALFGVKCPYCGKSDQIRKLETPEELRHVVDAEALASYSGFLQKNNHVETSIGVCGFCRNCLTLTQGGRAEPLLKDDSGL